MQFGGNHNMIKLHRFDDFDSSIEFIGGMRGCPDYVAPQQVGIMKWCFFYEQAMAGNYLRGRALTIPSLNRLNHYCAEQTALSSKAKTNVLERRYFNDTSNDLNYLYFKGWGWFSRSKNTQRFQLDDNTASRGWTLRRRIYPGRRFIWANWAQRSPSCRGKWG